MTEKPKKADVVSKSHWNDSYSLRNSTALWGDSPVPFASTAAELFRQANSQIVADLPCGDGRNTIVLAKELPFVFALDASENALQLACSRFESMRIQNCVLQQCDIFNTKFQEGQFDGVFCWDALGHFQDVSAATAEVIRICRKGGRIIGTLFATSDPNLGIEMTPMGKNEYLYKDKFYYKFYTRENVESFLSQFPTELLSFHLEKWNEPPHEVFREYPHEHHSWVFVLKKK